MYFSTGLRAIWEDVPSGKFSEIEKAHKSWLSKSRCCDMHEKEQLSLRTEVSISKVKEYNCPNRDPQQHQQL